MTFKPIKVNSPRLDISIESMETFYLLKKTVELNFLIPPPYTFADIEWVKTSFWYKPWTWGKGYIRIKPSAIIEVEGENKETAFFQLIQPILTKKEQGRVMGAFREVLSTIKIYEEVNHEN